MYDIIDFIAFRDMRNDLDGEVLGVLKHIHYNLLNSYLDGRLQFIQEVFFVLQLT